MGVPAAVAAGALATAALALSGGHDGLAVRCLVDSINDATFAGPGDDAPLDPVVLPIESLSVEGKFGDGRLSLALPLAVDFAHELEIVRTDATAAVPVDAAALRATRWIRGEQRFPPAQFTAFQRLPKSTARSGRGGVRIAATTSVDFAIERTGRGATLAFVFESDRPSLTATPAVTLADDAGRTLPRAREAAAPDRIVFALPDRTGSQRLTVRFETPPSGENVVLVALELSESDGLDRIVVPDALLTARASVRYLPLPPAPVIALDAVAAPDGPLSATVLLRAGSCALVGPGAASFALEGISASVAPSTTTDPERDFVVTRPGTARLWRTATRATDACWLVQPASLWSQPLVFNRRMVAEPVHPWIHSIELGAETRRTLVLRPGREVRFPCGDLDGASLEFEVATVVLQPGPFEPAPLHLEVRLRGDVGAAASAADVEDRLVVSAGAPVAGERPAWSRASWRPFRVALTARSAAREIVLRCPLPDDLPVTSQLTALLVAEPRIVRKLARPPPNLLIYLVDTLRADRVSCIDPALPTTPSVDALARDGIVFRRALSNAPWTRPSVATLFSGLLPEQHGVTFATALPTKVDTLAERMRRAGFETAAFPVNGHVHAAGLAFEQGFDRFVAAQPPAGEPPHATTLNDQVGPWLESHGDRPFFLYVHTLDPHDPYSPPDATFGRFGSRRHVGRITPSATRNARISELLPLTDDELAEARSLYAEDVLANDLAFGALLAKLQELGLYDDTVILFMADHGEELDDHGAFGHVGRMWNEVLHVPVVLKLAGPDRPKGMVSDAPIRSIDLLPTLADLFGLEAGPAGFLGRSIAPVWKGGEFEALPAIAQDGPLIALVAGNWKLIVRRIDRDGGETSNLFDLAADPAEKNDLAATRPDEVTRMRALLAATLAEYAKRGFVPMSGSPFEPDDADRKRLAELGYAADH